MFLEHLPPVSGILLDAETVTMNKSDRTLTSWWIKVCVGYDTLGVIILLCLTLFCNPMDCSPPGSSVWVISQARILQWVAISFSRGIFPTQGLNPRLLPWHVSSFPLSQLGSPHWVLWCQTCGHLKSLWCLQHTLRFLIFKYQQYLLESRF